jgi:hypothetical protein
MIHVRLQMGFGLVNGFIDHLHTPFELQAFTALQPISTLYQSLHAISSPDCIVFTSLNNGDSSSVTIRRVSQD